MCRNSGALSFGASIASVNSRMSFCAGFAPPFGWGSGFANIESMSSWALLDGAGAGTGARGGGAAGFAAAGGRGGAGGGGDTAGAGRGAAAGFAGSGAFAGCVIPSPARNAKVCAFPRESRAFPPGATTLGSMACRGPKASKSRKFPRQCAALRCHCRARTRPRGPRLPTVRTAQPDPAVENLLIVAHRIVDRNIEAEDGDLETADG